MKIVFLTLVALFINISDAQNEDKWVHSSDKEKMYLTLENYMSENSFDEAYYLLPTAIEYRWKNYSSLIRLTLPGKESWTVFFDKDGYASNLTHSSLNNKDNEPYDKSVILKNYGIDEDLKEDITIDFSFPHMAEFINEDSNFNHEGTFIVEMESPNKYSGFFYKKKNQRIIDLIGLIKLQADTVADYYNDTNGALILNEPEVNKLTGIKKEALPEQKYINSIIPSSKEAENIIRITEHDSWGQDNYIFECAKDNTPLIVHSYYIRIKHSGKKVDYLFSKETRIIPDNMKNKIKNCLSEKFFRKIAKDYLMGKDRNTLRPGGSDSPRYLLEYYNTSNQLFTGYFYTQYSPILAEKIFLLRKIMRPLFLSKEEIAEELIMDEESLISEQKSKEEESKEFEKRKMELKLYKDKAWARHRDPYRKY